MSSREGDAVNVPLEAGYIVSIVINSIACPFTVLLNVRVIMAVKRKPQLRTKSNILLACLAVTDAFTGLLGQPSFIMWRAFKLLGLKGSQIIVRFHLDTLSVLLMASYLHLMLVTLERLLAIKFTMLYSNIVTDYNIKRALIMVWIIAFMCGIFSVLKMYRVLFPMGGLITISCIVFVAFAYVILYRETRRHQRRIKAQLMSQEEAEIFTKENKALKTTLLVIVAVLVCLLPLCFCQISMSTGLFDGCPIKVDVVQTFVMVNSLVNPLIYCWRQKEMRKYIFGKGAQVVHPVIH